MNRIPLMCLIVLLSAAAWALPSVRRAAAGPPNNSIHPQTNPTSESTTTQKDGGLYVERDGEAAEAEFVPGEVLVMFKEGADADEAVSKGRGRAGSINMARSPGLTRVFERFGVSRAGKLFARAKSAKLSRVVKMVSGPHAGAEETRALIGELRRQPEVEFAEPNVIVRIQQAAPNDPYYASAGAWGQNIGDLWGLHKIGAAAAWGSSQGEGVVVAVVDTGLDYNHEDIASNVWQNAGEVGTDAAGRDKRSNGADDDANGYVDDWRGWDFITSDGTPADNDPADNHGHGTHVSGTIAAVANNGLGVVGVAPRARVMPLKGLDVNGNGTIEDLSRAIVYAADNGAQVINNSWGGGPFETPQTLVQAVTHAHDVRGAVVVAAAGNSNWEVGTQAKGYYPANIRDVIAVSASTHDDLKASFSNFGAKIDVAAPGGGDTDPTGVIIQPARSVLSLLSSTANASMTGSGQLVVGAKYLRQMGTSMASPHVAGVAALVRSLHPEFSPEQVRQALRSSSDEAGAAGFDAQFGYGRVNAARAMTQSSPLVAQLTGPTVTMTGLTQVDVTGTAAGSGLASWRLEYGAGTAPAGWATVAASSNEITEGVLAPWDLTNVPDGTHTLRLVAQNASGQGYEDRLTVVVDNVIITEPSSLQLSVVRGGQSIILRGSAASSNFARYTVTIQGSNGATLPGPNVVLTNGGLAPVRNDVLATWDTNGVAADHYRIFLNEYLTTGALVQESVKVAVDPGLREGWPRNVGLLSNGMVSWAITDQLTAADIDGDGGKEIIVGYNTQIHVYTHTGAELPGWPRSVDPMNVGGKTQRGAAVADLDGDGSPEIIAANDQRQILIYRADGTQVPGWPKTLGGTFTMLAVDDINNDGVKEIIASADTRVVALNLQGAHLPGFPVFPGSYLTRPAVGDVDGDGKKEIVVAGDTGPTKLFIINSNGTIRAGWPRTINPTLASNFTSPSQPVLGDLDADGDLEVVMGSADGKVYALHHDGTDVAGWPQLTKAARVNSPAIGDIDGDGSPEVIAGNDRMIENSANANYLFAWRADGTPLSGWPVKYDRPISMSSFGFGAPALADLDQDGRADVIAASDANFENPFALNAYRFDGTKVANFPKPTVRTGSYPSSTVAVADTDGDGRLELAWIDGDANLYVWNLTAPSSALMPWPMFMRDERRTGFSPKTNETRPPTVSLSSPADGALIFGTFNVAAAAADNVGVSRVEFYLDSAHVATSDAAPYGFSWDTATATDGAHTLVAKAYDTGGNAGASQPVNFTVDNGAPSVSVVSPAAGGFVSANAVVTAQAADAASGVAFVEFYLDSALVGSDSSAPYSLNWDTRTVADGPHTLSSRAYDAAGHAADSAGVSVTVDNGSPAASIASPSGGALVSATISVTVNASDAVGVTRVELYRGAALVGTDTAAPYAFDWDTRTAAAGAHTLTAKAYDAVGNVATSAGVSVTVDNTPPTAAVTAPANGALVKGTAVTVSANATDASGVQKVDFYAAGVLVGSDTVAPYSVVWNSVATTPSGAVTLYAVSTDAAGNTKTSSTVTVTVDNLAPVVDVTNPANGSVVQRRSTVTIAATATDSVGVTKVEFFVGGVLRCTDTAAPYTCAWLVPNTVSTHNIDAKGYDAAGNSTIKRVTVTSK